jgi:quinol-cytochrome oxidoreductase complex cytochrome b subunit
MKTAEYTGTERRVSERRQVALPEKSEQFIIVKSWHILISVITLIVVITLFFGSLRDDTINNTREIQEMKQQNLTRDLYELGQKNTEQRLERIEKKLDAQDVRNFAADTAASRKSKKEIE